MGKKTACKCDHCKRARSINRVVKRGHKPSLVAVIRELEDALYHTQEELGYSNAILDGSWPTAIEQLERALVKAKNSRDTYLKTCADESKAAEERGRQNNKPKTRP